MGARDVVEVDVGDERGPVWTVMNPPVLAVFPAVEVGPGFASGPPTSPAVPVGPGVSVAAAVDGGAV